MESLEFLERWYQGRCNGYWEHGKGVTIETLAQPGWLVSIDLAETPLETRAMDPVRRETSAKDWIACEVSHGQFRGQGDSRKLAEILRVFQAWAAEATPLPR